MYQDLLEKLNELKDYKIETKDESLVKRIADTPNENIYVILGGTYKTAYNDERWDNILSQITSRKGTYTVVCNTRDRTFIPRILEYALKKNNLQIVIIGTIYRGWLSEIALYQQLIKQGKILYIRPKDDIDNHYNFNVFIEIAHTLGDTHHPLKHILVDIQKGNYQRVVWEIMQTHQLFVVWLPRIKEEIYSANVELAQKLGINVHALTNKERLELNENIIRRIDEHYGNK